MSDFAILQDAFKDFSKSKTMPTRVCRQFGLDGRHNWCVGLIEATVTIDDGTTYSLSAVCKTCGKETSAERMFNPVDMLKL